jgi:head-tail adaptor
MHDGAVNAVGFWRFTIRQRGDVSERDRLIWNGEPYNITRVARASQRELYLIIDAKRGAAQ